jgi:hypothetical protein
MTRRGGLIPACITARTCRNRHLMPIIRFPRERGGGEAVRRLGSTTKAGYTSGAIKPINMQRSGPLYWLTIRTCGQPT